MTAETGTTALTDDEVLAVSALAGRPWPFGLPTVPAEDDALQSAATRGLRSLTVRGLLTADNGRNSVSDAIASAVDGLSGAPLIVSATLVLATEPLGPLGPAMLVGAHGSSAVVDVVTGDGVHLVTRVDPETAESELSRFLRAVFDGSPAPEGTPETAVLVRSSMQTSSHVVVPGRILEGVLDEATSTLRPASASTDWEAFRAGLGVLPGPA